jgi:transposase
MNNLFIGIDFSKEKLDVAIIFAEGVTETAARVYNEFKNTASGFKKLVKWVEKTAGDIESTSWLFCGENTGDYSKPLCNYLYCNDHNVWLENAMSIKNASGLRRLKSDRADASMIAEYAMRYHDKAVLYKPLGDSLTKLRELFHYRHMLVRQRCGLQVRRGEKKLTMEKSPVKTVISQSARHLITEFNKEIKKMDEKIEAVIAEDKELAALFEVLTSVPGIGTQSAVCLMVYTDNFRRFNYDARKIACYFGFAPFGRDSGTSVHTNPHVHFMANRQIKALLTQAALAAINFNPVIAAYYARLIDSGKKKQVALNNVKNKLVHIVTAMARNMQKFDPNYRISA